MLSIKEWNGRNSTSLLNHIDLNCLLNEVICLMDLNSLAGVSFRNPAQARALFDFGNCGRQPQVHCFLGPPQFQFQPPPPLLSPLEDLTLESGLGSDSDLGLGLDSGSCLGLGLGSGGGLGCLSFGFSGLLCWGWVVSSCDLPVGLTDGPMLALRRKPVLLRYRWA